MNRNNKLWIFSGIVILAVISGILFAKNYSRHNREKERVAYEKYLNKHAYSNRTAKSPGESEEGEEGEEEPKCDRPDLAFEQNYLMTLDPALGYPPTQRLFAVHEKVRNYKRMKSGTPGDSLNNWVERGPDNISGRVRAIMFDPNDLSSKKVWAGSVSGGLWFNNDITNANSVWQAVDDFWDNIAISSITYDPTNRQTFYVGTGEGWYNYDGVGGEGIWKTMDGGINWQHLENTNNSDFRTVQKLQVTSTGRVVAAGRNGIFISDDGGATWKMTFEGLAADLEIASDGAIYAGTGRVYVAGKVLKSTDNGDNWLDITPLGTEQERVEIAVAPSNSQVVYAIASNLDNISWFMKSMNGGKTWTKITLPKYMNTNCTMSSDDFTRGQAWYDLILAVHPTNQNIVFAGGIDLNKTVNGGFSWNTVSSWTGACLPYVHADQHAIIFRPGYPDELLGGSDGGVTYSVNAGMNPAPVFSDRNKGLNVTQYYACAMHPAPFSNYFLAGSQDNGTQKFESEGINSVTTVTGGDGGYCFIDQINPSIQITSFVYNNFTITRDGGKTFYWLWKATDGAFINPADYDNNLHILYSAKNKATINRITHIDTNPGYGAVTVADLGTMASGLKVSPYTTGSSTLFVGTRAGRLFKVTNAETESPVTEQITGSFFPVGNISNIELGASENEILVTFTNYGVSSVWYTKNGGTDWSEKEGNLPDMPVRSALFNPNNRNKVILATEVGIWSTSNFNDDVPIWKPTVSGLANVRIDMLELRESDFEILAATHGRGLFTNDAFSAIDKNILNVYFNTGAGTNLKFGGSVQFENHSTGKPTSFIWTFEGGNPATSTSMNPLVSYENSGSYDVTLTISDGTETKTETKTSYITVGGSNQWTEQATGFHVAERGIAFIDAVDSNIVWAIANNKNNQDIRIKEFTKTVNGGSQWTSSAINIPGDIYPAMVSAINENIAWIPMFPNSTGAGGGIYVTKNGGQIWTKQPTATFSGDKAFANVVHFWNANEGFCMGNPNGGYFEIYTTKNGGENWTRVAKNKIPTPSGTDEKGTAGQYCVGDDGVVFFNTSKGRIFKSKNKGESWNLIPWPVSGKSKIAFADENHGVVLSDDEDLNTFKVYNTTNGGATWNTVYKENVYSSRVAYVPGTGRMFVSSSANDGMAGSSYSIDGGTTWTRFAELDQFQCYALGFYNMASGWVGQFNTSGIQGGILKYTGLTRTLADFTINPENPVIELPIVFTDNSISVESSSTYHWDFGENASPRTANTVGPHTVSFSETGSKTVTLTVNGISVTKQFEVFTTTGIEDIYNQASVNVFPNPSQGAFNLLLMLRKMSDLDISVINSKGQIIYSNKLKNRIAEVNIPINLSKSGKGIYILNIKGGDMNVSRKLILN